MNATGSWNLTIRTPMGEQKLQVHLLADLVTVTGSIKDEAQLSTDIKEGSVRGDQLGFKFDVKKPFPMTVALSLILDGDTMKGTAKAGFFPPAPVSGFRA